MLKYPLKPKRYPVHYTHILFADDLRAAPIPLHIYLHLRYPDMPQELDTQAAFINGQAVDTETGEIKDDSIVDFRAAKQA